MSFLDIPVKFKGGRPWKITQDQLKEAQKLKQDGYTLGWIIEELNLNISPSALSRDIKRIAQ